MFSFGKWNWIYMCVMQSCKSFFGTVYWRLRHPDTELKRIKMTVEISIFGCRNSWIFINDYVYSALRTSSICRHTSVSMVWRLITRCTSARYRPRFVVVPCYVQLMQTAGPAVLYECLWTVFLWDFWPDCLEWHAGSLALLWFNS